MQKILLIATFLCFTCVAKASNDKELARSYLLWVWNKSLPDFLVSQLPAEKALVEKKFKKAMDNIQKSGIILGAAVVTDVYSIDVLGTYKRVLLVIYKTTDGAQWDDVVLYLEKGKSLILDIGDVENSFTKNSKTVGRNYSNKDMLPILFDKNAVTASMVMNETKLLIRLANNSKIDSFCRKVLYTGIDTLNRKSGMAPCNPAIPKDKIYCIAVMDDLGGYITDPNDVEVRYLKSDEKAISLKIKCNRSKNEKELVFSIVKGKLLLKSIY